MAAPHLLQCLSKAQSKRIVLASQSPRRKEILETIGLRFSIVPSTFPETLDKSSFSSAGDYVIENARQKALEVFGRLAGEGGEASPELVIGADTVVVGTDGGILEKPASEAAAVTMLQGLSGTTHEVVSGVVLLVPAAGDGSVAREQAAWATSTKVHFAEASRETLTAYAATGEPLDKAGGYGIQALGAMLISGIEGDYNNVKGFPLYDFAKHLAVWLQEADGNAAASAAPPVAAAAASTPDASAQ